MREEIKFYHDLGFAVHLLHVKSKRPIETKWSSGERKSLAELNRTFKTGMNIGVRLGTPSKINGKYLYVIDCDVKSTDKKHLKEMEAALAQQIGEGNLTPICISGRGNGSRHVYGLSLAPVSSRRMTQSPEKVKVMMPSVKPSQSEMETLTKAELNKGIRLRAAWELSLMGDGSQVVLPPSIHPDSGRAYKWKAPFKAKYLMVADYGKLDRADTGEKLKDFKAEYVDLVSSTLPDRIVNQIISGKDVSDRSGALLGVTNSMLKHRFTENQILSVLTDPDNYLGEVAYDHTQSKSRKRAAEWVRRYTIEKSKAETSAAAQFDSEVEVTKYLSKEEAQAQIDEIVHVPEWRDQIERSSIKEGARPKNTMKNVMLILQGEGGRDIFKRDEFAHAELYGQSAPWGSKRGAELIDLDTVRIKSWLADRWGFEPSNDRINEAVSKIADVNRFHPVRDYLDGLRWDGVARLDTWLKDYMGAEAAEPYLSAVSRKTLVAMVKRIYEPGCKFDHVLILENRKQGIGKSTSVRMLASDEWFSDAHINVSDKDAILTMRSVWVIELGELSGMRKADVDTLKEFVSRTTDRIRVPYGKKAENFPRQCIFIGTTNSEEYLKDPTGNRRFWPVKVGACDFKAIKANRDQLLAEAVFAYQIGEPIYLEDEDMVKGATAEQESRTTHDSLTDVVADWLARGDTDESVTPITDRSRFRMEDLFEDGAPMAGRKMDMNEQKRVGEVLRKLGYISKAVRDKNKIRKYWVKREN